MNNSAPSSPEIWVGTFRSYEEFQEFQRQNELWLSAMGELDQQLIAAGLPKEIPAVCAVCGSLQFMRIKPFDEEGATVVAAPTWSENVVCLGCGLLNRMRAVVSAVKEFTADRPALAVYVAEQKTFSFSKIQALHPTVVGSEFLGEGIAGGATVDGMRHEDLTALSFPSKSFDLVVTQEVFEHIPDFGTAFREVARVLKKRGQMIFTVPLDWTAATTTIRASLVDGQIVNALPLVVHGNPVLAEGSLVFQDFGWDILDELRSAGFRDAYARMAWQPLCGHLGTPVLVFSAER